jgi:2-phospho-L-lactate guanylyltransferase
MRATAVVPIKRFDAAKQRLSDALAPGDRARLAAAMAADVLEVLTACEAIERTIVVSGEPEVAALAARAGVEIVDDPDDAGHSEAALIGVAAAESAGAKCVALLPGDCPLLDAAELERALEAQGEGPCVGVIPDRHGAGTNGLLLSPPGAIVPAFGPGSRERHLALAAEAGAEARIAEVPSMGLDLDTGEDLAELHARVAAAGHATAPRTTAALALLTRTLP